MAKYPDINKIHAELSGEGWHMENHPESVVKSETGRRRKSKCRFLKSNTCQCNDSGYYHQLCIGKVHCSSWKAQL